MSLRFFRVPNIAQPMIATNMVLKRQAVTLHDLKAKRVMYDEKVKLEFVKAANEYGVAEALRRAHNTSGYEHVTHRSLKRWKKQVNKNKKKPGPKGTSEAFQSAVLSYLIFASVENVDNKAQLAIEANVSWISL